MQSCFACNLEIYCGIQADTPYKASNKPTDVVLQICQPIYDSGQNVTADNMFSNIPLVNELQKKT